MLFKSMIKSATGRATATLRPLGSSAIVLSQSNAPRLGCQAKSQWQPARSFSASPKRSENKLKCPTTSSGLPKLTLLEKLAPAAYLRVVYPFELPENYDINEVTRVLQTAHAATCKRIPHMASIVAPTMEDGVMTQELQHRQKGDIEDFIINDLRKPGAYPVTFKELQDRHFPSEDLDPEKLCKYNNVWFPPTERHPTSFVQANFIQGGLLLAWKFNHLAMDGNSLTAWTQTFAEECRKVQGLPITDPINLEEMYSCRELVMKGSPKEGSTRIEDNPGFEIWPTTKPAPARLLESDWATAVYYLPKSSQKALKALASPTNATIKTNQSWISTNDAIAALKWRVSMQAQGPPVNPEETSEVCIAVDGRRKNDMDIHPREMGCFLQPASAFAPLGKVYDESLTLADLALLIRQAVLRAISKTSVHNHLALAQKLRDEGGKQSLIYSVLPRTPHAGVLLTSWTDFNVRAYDWGPLFGKIQAVRIPSTGYLNGTHVILPRLPDGGLELFFCLPKDGIEALKHNKLLNKYAVRR